MAREYKKTLWVNEETPLNASNLNKIEEGIEENTNDLAAHEADITKIDEDLKQTKINLVEFAETVADKLANIKTDAFKSIFDVENSDETYDNKIIYEVPRWCKGELPFNEWSPVPVKTLYFNKILSQWTTKAIISIALMANGLIYSPENFCWPDDDSQSFADSFNIFTFNDGEEGLELFCAYDEENGPYIELYLFTLGYNEVIWDSNSGWHSDCPEFIEINGDVIFNSDDNSISMSNLFGDLLSNMMSIKPYDPEELALVEELDGDYTGVDYYINGDYWWQKLNGGDGTQESSDIKDIESIEAAISPIPLSGYVDKVYINNSLSLEEVIQEMQKLPAPNFELGVPLIVTTNDRNTPPKACVTAMYRQQDGNYFVALIDIGKLYAAMSNVTSQEELLLAMIDAFIFYYDPARLLNLPITFEGWNPNFSGEVIIDGEVATELYVDDTITSPVYDTPEEIINLIYTKTSSDDVDTKTIYRLPTPNGDYTYHQIKNGEWEYFGGNIIPVENLSDVEKISGTPLAVNVDKKAIYRIKKNEDYVYYQYTSTGWKELNVNTIKCTPIHKLYNPGDLVGYPIKKCINAGKVLVYINKAISNERMQELCSSIYYDDTGNYFICGSPNTKSFVGIHRETAQTTNEQGKSEYSYSIMAVNTETGASGYIWSTNYGWELDIPWGFGVDTSPAEAVEMSEDTDNQSLIGLFNAVLSEAFSSEPFTTAMLTPDKDVVYQLETVKFVPGTRQPVPNTAVDFNGKIYVNTSLPKEKVIELLMKLPYYRVYPTSSGIQSPIYIGVYNGPAYTNTATWTLYAEADASQRNRVYLKLKCTDPSFSYTLFNYSNGWTADSCLESDGSIKEPMLGSLSKSFYDMFYQASLQDRGSSPIGIGNSLIQDILYTKGTPDSYQKFYEYYRYTNNGWESLGSGGGISPEDMDAILQEAKTYTDEMKQSLLGEGISETFDTLKEIQDWIETDGVEATELATELAKKQNKLTAGNGISISEDGTISLNIPLAEEEKY